MKYRYANTSRRQVVIFCLASILVAICNIYGLYRYQFISVPNFIIAAYMVVYTFFATYYLLLGFKDFNIKTHRKLARKMRSTQISILPSIDVFLPTAGEDLITLRRTYRAVQRLDYPESKLHVYVLDDSGRDIIKKEAKRFGFKYYSRPNKGEFKKAGNLKYGFERSTGKYILVLDADFAPRKEMLFELVGYPEQDEKIGITQSPQDFNINKSEPAYIQKADIALQEYFYRIVQNGRASSNSMICVGTNALYRREALKKGGGFYQIEHSEDAHTGLLVVKQGYKLSYIPVTLARGYCPSNFKAVYKQRSRWCRGAMGMLGTRMFWETRSSFASFVSYFSGFIYYIGSFVVLLAALHTLYLLQLPSTSSTIDAVFFLPGVIFLFLSTTLYYAPRFSFSMLGSQLFFAFTYAYSILLAVVFRKNEPWTPTGAKQNKNNNYNMLIAIILLYCSVYLSCLLYILLSGKFTFRLSRVILLFWAVYSAASQVSLLYGLYVGRARKKGNSTVKIGTVPFQLRSAG